jgi:thioredoxin 1
MIWKRFHENYPAWSTPTMAAAYLKDEAELDSTLQSEPVVVVDCTASWCGPCKLVAPLMDQLSEEYDGRVKVMKLDLDSNKSVAQRFGIKSIPAVLVFKNGELVDTLVGVKPYSTFSEAVTSYL